MLNGQGVWGRRETQFGHRGGQIVGAVVVVAFVAEQPIAVGIAGRVQGVVDPRCRILDDGQDRPPAVGQERLTDLGHHLVDGATRVLHGHVFAEVVGVERPGIDDLGAVGVDHLHELPAGEPVRLALAGGNQDQALGRLRLAGHQPYPRFRHAASSARTVSSRSCWVWTVDTKRRVLGST